ncbi:prolactin-3D1-like [Arvicola amphibius]|uniref:prolactin-3D1-like n=1 Tax=Arvicola amphibius TaxID=1047088 RepID=UPI0018E29774|nr:prolactin-3D1-like [Arvicola amphibius]
MQLTSTFPGSAVMCMMLLVSSLLLWEHAASKPTGVVSTEDLYDRVVEQSHTTYNLAADIYHEFDSNFFKITWFPKRMPRLCHTASIHTPESRQEVNETKTEDLLKAIINITNAWEEPLKHLVSAVTSLPKPSDNMLKTANTLKHKNLVLLEGLKTILNRTKIVYEENDSPVWSGLSEIQSADEDTQLFAFYNLVRCLRRDTHKIDTFLKVLRGRVIYNNECLF